MSEAITIEGLEQNKENKKYLEEKLIKIEDIFEDNQEIILKPKKLELFLNGVKLNLDKQNRNI